MRTAFIGLEGLFCWKHAQDTANFSAERAPWGADYVLKVLPRFGLDPLPGGPALMECADRVRGQSVPKISRRHTVE